MTVKKNIPCSLYDFEGLQSWLDEMALQGLFFQNFSRRNDYAKFEPGDPRPVRYRLDPVGRDKEEDKKRKEPYAQMGWTFVDTLPRMYYIFSCEDPEAPELHSDPQVLAYALDNTIQKQITFHTLDTMIPVLLLLIVFLAFPNSYLTQLFLIERPRSLMVFAMACVILFIYTVVAVLQVRRLVSTRRALAQGFTPKPGRRWTRPRSITVSLLLVMLPLCVLPSLLVPANRCQYYDLGEAELSYQPPTLYQLEAAGPQPLEEEPEAEGYLKLNRSWLVPVQEYTSVDWDTNPYPAPSRPYLLWMTVQYHQARSPWTARVVYGLERNRMARYMQKGTRRYSPSGHITELTPFAPLDCPRLDRLEAAHCKRNGQDSWAFAALRGNEVLVVEYTGYASLEDCLELFLDALDG